MSLAEPNFPYKDSSPLQSAWGVFFALSALSLGFELGVKPLMSVRLLLDNMHCKKKHYKSKIPMALD